MRTIKFRAWDKLAKSMFQVSAMNNFDSESFNLYKKDCELMQYTGLKDKNGKEIYEGDLVKYYLPTLKRWHIGKVEWSDNWAGFWLTDKEWSDPDWVKLEQKEIIGNIYENPELLK